ncbi:MAG: 50S ribosomal protein L10 [Solirubrobacterales bacterium]
MNKEEKAALVDEIADRLGDASAIFAVDYRGISVPQAAELRSQLSEADATFRVVKNRLAKRAVERAGTPELDSLLVGPTALTFIKGDAVVAAKAISTFGRQNEILEYKGGLMDGAPLDPDQFSVIARLPGLDVLRGQLVGVAASPLTGLTRGLASMVSGLAVALGEIRDKGLVKGEAEAPAESPAEAAPEGEAPAESAAEAAPEAEEPAEAAADEPSGDAEDAAGEEEPAGAEESGEAEGDGVEVPETEAEAPSDGEGSDEDSSGE